jgi:hypothetical protein
MKTKTGRDAVVVAFIDAYATAENTGGKIAQVCALARTTYSGDDVPKEDADYIADSIAKQREWTGDTAKVRKSEVRRVLSVYSVLGEGITAVRTKLGSCDWRAALRLATLLKKHEGKLKPALTAFYVSGESRKANPAGRAAGALKGWYKVAKGDKRAAILKAAEMLGLKLGIKVEA